MWNYWWQMLYEQVIKTTLYIYFIIRKLSWSFIASLLLYFYISMKRKLDSSISFLSFRFALSIDRFVGFLKLCLTGNLLVMSFRKMASDWIIEKEITPCLFSIWWFLPNQSYWLYSFQAEFSRIIYR